MYVKKKTRTRLLILAIVVLAVIFWRGLRATTAQTHDCQYKIIYAVCTAKKAGVKLPGFFDIIKAGVKF